MGKEVVLYMTSATGIHSTKKHTTSIKYLLESKKVPYVEVDCAVDAEKRKEMAAASGTNLLPQVFVDKKYIGGWEELETLNEEDRFDEVFK